MTDSMLRAIVIAASVFLVVAVVTVGVLYYMTVINVTDQFNDRVDLSNNYEYSMVKKIEDKYYSNDNITGIDMRNLIYTLQGMKEFSINMVNNGNTIIKADLNNTLIDATGSINMLEIQKLIHPNAEVTIRKFETINNILNINLYVIN